MQKSEKRAKSPSAVCATMAIFLGKQYLGQRDNVDVNVTNSEGLSLDELETMVIGFDAGSGDSNSPE